MHHPRPHLPTFPTFPNNDKAYITPHPPELHAIAQGITEELQIKLPHITNKYPELTPTYHKHNCEITIDGGIFGGTICTIDLDNKLEIWKGNKKGKPHTTIDYADPQLLEKIITTITQLI